MAITVKNKKVTFKAVTLGGNEFTATDDAKAYGSLAFDDFENKDVVRVLGGASEVYIPYHAIDHVEITTSDSSDEINDANCVMPE